MAFYFPIVIIVISNLVYNICAKATPSDINPFASLIVTYLIGAAVAALLFFLMKPENTLLEEYKQMNWAPIVMGIVVVGLEFGSILMYKMGWNINTGYMVHSTCLAILLIFVGYIGYGEDITITKLLGVILCITGLYLIKK